MRNRNVRTRYSSRASYNCPDFRQLFACYATLQPCRGKKPIVEMTIIITSSSLRGGENESDEKTDTRGEYFGPC